MSFVIILGIASRMSVPSISVCQSGLLVSCIADSKRPGSRRRCDRKFHSPIGEYISLEIKTPELISSLKSTASMYVYISFSIGSYITNRQGRKLGHSPGFFSPT